METYQSLRQQGRISRVGLMGLLTLLLVSGGGLVVGLWKLLGIAWVAFTAMAGGAMLGARAAERSSATGLVWAYGTCAGAMITSAAVFLVPTAITHSAAWGGFGIAAGLFTGFAVHMLSHQLTHARLSWDPIVVQLSAHALGAGLIIGLIYASMPHLGLTLGLAIVSHKGPAGYAAARRWARSGKAASVILLPAAGIGITALPMGMMQLGVHPVLDALIFGFAAGVFLHVAMDFLPRCEADGDIPETAGLTENDHHLLDRLRLHGVASTALGGLAVLAAWLVVTG